MIIAEAGVNHNGDMALAKDLICAATEAGAHYVKFQSFKASKHATRYAQKANYQMTANSGTDDDCQYDMLKNLELSDEAHIELMEFCNANGIKFLSSPFDPDGIEYLCSIGVDTIKVPSGEIINLPYLRKAGQSGLPVLMSCGMATLGEIDAAINLLFYNGLKRDNLTLLHCNTEYPTPYTDANLNAIKSLSATFNLRIGYSDHTMGIEAPIAAVALGAVVIEKHFTLSRSMEGPDHKASLEPDELTMMVKAIRNVELSLGDGYKHRTPSESKNLAAARKSIFLSQSVQEGDHLSPEMLVMLRPGDGISPMEVDNLIGRRSKLDLPMHHKLTWNDIK